MRKKKFANSILRERQFKKNAFTLIELLAIIVILAIIAVITVPLILNIINDSKKGAAKDSSYGYKKGIENFYLSRFSQDQSFKFEDRAYTTEELKNLGLQISGQEPSGGEVVFENNRIKSFVLEYDEFICDYSIDNDVNCSENTGLYIKSIKHESTTNSISITVDIYGTATSYEYKINDGEFVSSNSNTYLFENLENNVEYEITVKVKDDAGEVLRTKKIRTESLNVGDAISYGGYNWHVIRNYEEDGTTYQTLLMDAGQLDNMAHCTNDTDESTDCGTDGTYLVYSWDKSFIQTYLNDSFIQTLQSNGVDTSKIKKEKVCIDPSKGIIDTYSYGGYIKEEVESVEGSCSKYEEYQIRLITASEYYNLSYVYRNIELPYTGIIGTGGASGKVAKLDGMERLSETDSKSWLYSSSIGYWWSMGSYSGAHASHLPYARNVHAVGAWDYNYSNDSYGVRAVLSIAK